MIKRGFVFIVLLVFVLGGVFAMSQEVMQKYINGFGDQGATAQSEHDGKGNYEKVEMNTNDKSINLREFVGGDRNIFVKGEFDITKKDGVTEVVVKNKDVYITDAVGNSFDVTYVKGKYNHLKFDEEGNTIEADLRIKPSTIDLEGGQYEITKEGDFYYSRGEGVLDEEKLLKLPDGSKITKNPNSTRVDISNINDKIELPSGDKLQSSAYFDEDGRLKIDPLKETLKINGLEMDALAGNKGTSICFDKEDCGAFYIYFGEKELEATSFVRLDFNREVLEEENFYLPLKSDEHLTINTGGDSHINIREKITGEGEVDIPLREVILNIEGNPKNFKLEAGPGELYIGDGGKIRYRKNIGYESYGSPNMEINLGDPKRKIDIIGFRSDFEKEEGFGNSKKIILGFDESKPHTEVFIGKSAKETFRNADISLTQKKLQTMEENFARLKKSGMIEMIPKKTIDMYGRLAGKYPNSIKTKYVIKEDKIILASK